MSQKSSLPQSRHFCPTCADGEHLKLIGRIRTEHLAELRGQIAASAPSALELKEVTLVDAEVVRFLSACESEGIQSPTLLSLHTRVDRQGTGKRRQRVNHPPATLPEIYQQPVFRGLVTGMS
jgi:hypothetical protein